MCNKSALRTQLSALFGLLVVGILTSILALIPVMWRSRVLFELEMPLLFVGGLICVVWPWRLDDRGLRRPHRVRKSSKKLGRRYGCTCAHLIAVSDILLRYSCCLSVWLLRSLSTVGLVRATAASFTLHIKLMFLFLFCGVFDIPENLEVRGFATKKEVLVSLAFLLSVLQFMRPCIKIINGSNC